MKILLLAITSLILAGCATTNPELIVTKTTVVMPNNSLFYCPTVRSFPDTTNLTDVQVSQLLVQLYKNNETCKASIEAIRQYLIKARSIN